MATPTHNFLHGNTLPPYALYPVENFAARMILEQDSLFKKNSKRLQRKLVKPHKIVNTHKNSESKENNFLKFILIFIVLKGTLRKIVDYDYRKHIDVP